MGNMGKPQKEWAKRARVALLQVLGGKCKRCGVTEDLQFDCIVPQGDYHHRMDTSARISFYRGQHRLGNVQVLCDRCHSIKTHQDELAALLSTDSVSVQEQPY